MIKEWYRPGEVRGVKERIGWIADGKSMRQTKKGITAKGYISSKQTLISAGRYSSTEVELRPPNITVPPVSVTRRDPAASPLIPDPVSDLGVRSDRRVHEGTTTVLASFERTTSDGQ